MIKELVNFIEDLERNDPDIHQKNVGLKEGLYLFIRFEEGGKISIVNQLPYYEKKVGETKITISAQLYLKSFYESHGFIQTSEMYLEDDIPHIEMIKE